MHTTTLFPRGQYRTVQGDETEREIEENTPEEGDLEMPSTAQMANVNMWVHAKENILRNGRTVHQDVEPAEGEEDFDPEEAKKAQVAKDPYEPRLKPLTEDGAVKVSVTSSVPAWQVRMCGDATELINL
jgi:hypothetical protein